MTGQTGNYGGLSAQQRASARRDTLLEATLAVWSDPARKTTMTAICREAGLTERYFYESFRNLPEALRHTMDAVAAELEETAQSAADAAGDDPARRTRAMLEAFLDLLAADPRKGRVSLIESVAVPELRQRRTELLHHFARRVAEEARVTPGLRCTGGPEDVTAGLLFIGGLAELVTGWLDGTVETSPEGITNAATASFLGMFGGPGAPPGI